MDEGVSFLSDMDLPSPDTEYFADEYPTCEEFEAIMEELNALGNVPGMRDNDWQAPPTPDFKNPRIASNYIKVIAVWLVNRCTNYMQCQKAIGHFPLSLILEVIVQLLKTLRPRLVNLSPDSIKAMCRLNLLRRTMPFTDREFPSFPDNSADIILSVGGANDPMEPEEISMAAIRCANTAIRRDIARIPSPIMRNLACYIVYHAIFIVRDFCLSSYNFDDRYTDLMWLRNLIKKQFLLQAAIMRLAHRLGPTYFTYPAQLLPNLFVRPGEQMDPLLLNRRLFSTGAHCFMNVIATGCYEAYFPGTGPEFAMMHRDGTLCGLNCPCTLYEPIFLEAFSNKGTPRPT